MLNQDKTNGYALALYSIALEEKKLLNIKKDSEILLEAFEQAKEIISILSAKIISQKDIESIVSKSFKEIDINIVNFIKIVSNKKEPQIILSVLKKLIMFINENLGIEEGIIYTTISLTKKEIIAFENKITKLLKINLKLQNKIDLDLISGFKIVIGDNVIEDSIISRIHNIKYALLRGGS